MQRPEHDAAIPWNQHHGPLAPVKDQPGDADRLARGHGIADHREGFLTDGVVRHEVMRLVVPDPPDRIGRNELVDVDGARALERHSFEVLVLDHHVIVGTALVAFDFIVGLDRLVRRCVDVPAFDSIAGDAVERVKADLLAFRGGRRHGHRAGDQRQLQITLPERPWSHVDALGDQRGLNAAMGCRVPDPSFVLGMLNGARERTREKQGRCPLCCKFAILDAEIAGE